MIQAGIKVWVVSPAVDMHFYIREGKAIECKHGIVTVHGEGSYIYNVDERYVFASKQEAQMYIRITALNAIQLLQ